MAELEITLLKEQEPEKAIILDNEPMSVDAYEDGYKLGYDEGYNKAESENPLPYINIKDHQWNSVAFPEGFNFVLNLKNKPYTLNGMLLGATGIKTVTLISDAEGTTNFAQLVRETPIETLDLSGFKPKPNSISYMCYCAKNLVSIIGALDLSSCTQATIPFDGAFALENIEFAPNTIPISIKFGECRKLTHDSLMSIINGLADLTGSATQTVTFHKTVKAKLTDSQIATATQKNWTIA